MACPKRLALFVCGALVLSLATVSVAQTYIYPSRGQSAQQQEFDRGQCYSWAVQQSGFDPANPQVAAAPPPYPGAPQGGALRGAAGGAAMGAVGGAIGGDAGKGAAIGAAVGGLFGAIRRHRPHGPRSSNSSRRATRRSSRAPWPRGMPTTTAPSPPA